MWENRLRRTQKLFSPLTGPPDHPKRRATCSTSSGLRLHYPSVPWASRTATHVLPAGSTRHGLGFLSDTHSCDHRSRYSRTLILLPGAGCLSGSGVGHIGTGRPKKPPAQRKVWECRFRQDDAPFLDLKRLAGVDVAFTLPAREICRVWMFALNVALLGTTSMPSQWISPVTWQFRRNIPAGTLSFPSTSTPGSRKPTTLSSPSSSIASRLRSPFCQR